jgi:SpoIID/LytB domain protein
MAATPLQLRMVLPRVPAKVKKLALSVVTATVALSFWILASRQTTPSTVVHSSGAVAEELMDARLQQIIKKTLGDREGTVIVIDPQTGRVRSVINPELAFQKAYPPGSTIKPFTALAALRAGLIDQNSRTLCRTKYRHDAFAVVCSHPQDLAPLNPTEAIAYSCNYYFAKLGERLTEDQFDTTLADFGFGQKTGINSEHESPGRLLRGEWQPQNSIGEGSYLQVSPIQLLTAYSALLNGGRLLTPSIAPPDSFTPRVRKEIQISDDERFIIIEGMRGAVRYGTAERAGLNSLPLYVVGKTGTSAPITGFRTQGWFVGFAVSRDANTGATTEPSGINLGILVYLKNAHGAEAAEMSKSIFEEYERGTQKKEAEAVERSDTKSENAAIFSGIGAASSNLPGFASDIRAVTSEVRVHQVRENVTHTLSLEDYVLGVVSAEGSMEDQPEALKALAIAARTYALKNIQRHKSQGYDFCSTTHCQRFVAVEGVDLAHSGMPIASAVRDTAGLVLLDHEGGVAESYFGASCGGTTANLQTLWGVHAPPYLQGVRDEYCVSSPHHTWTDVISSDQLAQALRSDSRTDVGGKIHGLIITKRDQTGRAEVITIEGERQRTISGWEFKLVVGRALGWNLLKSSRFSITRSGSNFVFRGGGFGHGLGLCQEGSHVMAQRGFNYRQILTKYFPGTTVRGMRRMGDGEAGRRGYVNRESHADLLWGASPTLDLDSKPGIRSPNFRLSGGLTVPASSHVGVNSVSSSLRRFISSEHFRVGYPQSVSQRDATGLLQLLEANRANLLRRLTAAGILMELPYLEVLTNETTGDFVGRTRQPWWAAAATKEHQIELQPIAVLQRRGILETTIRHELVHVLIDGLGSGRTPRWLAEGMALNVAGEGPMLQRYLPKSRISTVALEQQLASASTPEEMRTAYAAAYDEVRNMIKNRGEARVWQGLAQQKEVSAK